MIKLKKQINLLVIFSMFLLAFFPCVSSGSGFYIGSSVAYHRLATHQLVHVNVFKQYESSQSIDLIDNEHNGNQHNQGLAAQLIVGYSHLWPKRIFTAIEGSYQYYCSNLMIENNWSAQPKFRQSHFEYHDNLDMPKQYSLALLTGISWPRYTLYLKAGYVYSMLRYRNQFIYSFIDAHNNDEISSSSTTAYIHANVLLLGAGVQVPISHHITFRVSSSAYLYDHVPSISVESASLSFNGHYDVCNSTVFYHHLSEYITGFSLIYYF